MNQIQPCVNSPVRSPVRRLRRRDFIPEDIIPEDITSLIAAVDGQLKTLAGPTALYSAAAGQVPDGAGGVQASTSAPVHAAGFYAGPAYTQLIKNSEFEGAVAGTPGTAPTSWTLLTGGGSLSISDGLVFTTTVSARQRIAQSFSAAANTAYIVVCDLNSINGTLTYYNLFEISNLPSGATVSYYIDDVLVPSPSTLTVSGVHTFKAVLNISSTAGSPSITIGISAYGSTAIGSASFQKVYCTGPYLFPYIKSPAAATISTVSTVGTTTGNGVSVPLTGSDAADRLIECFWGVPGEELIVNGTFESGISGWDAHTYPQIPTLAWDEPNKRLSFTTDQFGAVYPTAGIDVVPGDRLLVNVVDKNCDFWLAVNTSAGRSGHVNGSPGPENNASFEWVSTVTGNVTVMLQGRTAGTNTYYADNVSIKKLSPAVGTVAVLMKMGVGSGELFGTVTARNVLSIGDNTLAPMYFRGDTTTESTSSRLASTDGSTFANNSGIWSRYEYHAKVVEFNGTKFRVGNQRFNENGTAIDADIVWSHATLAGGVTFDGSFNPTTFLRWFLNSTVPNWMKCHFVSNQHSLGDAEIIRRLRKYGKF